MSSHDHDTHIQTSYIPRDTVPFILGYIQNQSLAGRPTSKLRSGRLVHFSEEQLLRTELHRVRSKLGNIYAFTWHSTRRSYRTGKSQVWTPGSSTSSFSLVTATDMLRFGR